jgi:hypothetical protein
LLVFIQVSMSALKQRKRFCSTMEAIGCNQAGTLGKRSNKMFAYCGIEVLSQLLQFKDPGKVMCSMLGRLAGPLQMLIAICLCKCHCSLIVYVLRTSKNIQITI